MARICGAPRSRRASALKSLLRGKHAGIVFNQRFDTDGVIVYRHALRGHRIEASRIALSVRPC
jgi:hypothetical protein